MVEFDIELRDQILRAYIRAPKVRLTPRPGVALPGWLAQYKESNYDQVPSSELHMHLKWEGTAKMADISCNNPTYR